MNKSESSEQGAAGKRPSARRVSTDSEPPVDASATFPKRAHARRPQLADSGERPAEALGAGVAERDAAEDAGAASAQSEARASEAPGSESRQAQAPAPPKPAAPARARARRPRASKPKAQASQSPQSSQSRSPGQTVRSGSLSQAGLESATAAQLSAAARDRRGAATVPPQAAGADAASNVIVGLGSPAQADAEAADLMRREGLLPPALDHADFADDFGLDPQYEVKLRPWLESLCERHFHVELEGAENIPAHGRALLVANHSRAAVWDGIVLRTAVRTHHPAGREARWLVDDQQFHAPFLGTFVNRLGAVRACQENAERLLLREQLVAVFPEGAKAAERPYEERYQLQRFGRGGYVKLALRTGAPVIPVAIVATEFEGAIWRNRLASASRLLGAPLSVLRPGFPHAGRFGVPPLSCRIRIFVGAPIPEISRQDASATGDDGLVHELNECVRGAVQSLVNASLHA